MDSKEENREGLLATFIKSFQSTFSKEETPSEKKLLVWDEFLDYMSNMIDNKIISYCKENSCKYIRGKCTFTGTVEETEFDKITVLNVDAILFFTASKEDKAIKLPLHTQRCYHDFNLEDQPTLGALRNVRKEQFIIEIAAPKESM